MFAPTKRGIGAVVEWPTVVADEDKHLCFGFGKQEDTANGRAESSVTLSSCSSADALVLSRARILSHCRHSPVLLHIDLDLSASMTVWMPLSISVYMAPATL